MRISAVQSGQFNAKVGRAQRRAAAGNLQLGRTYWAHGSSSTSGGQSQAGPSNGLTDMFTWAADTVQAGFCPTTVARTVRPNIDYTPIAGGRINNRGAGGTDAPTIASTMVTNTGAAGASDFFFNHIGDNNIGATQVQNLADPIGTYLGHYATMRTQAGARGYLQLVNTQGGRNGGGNAAEPPGGSFWPAFKNALLRRLNDLNPGRAVSLYQTLMDEIIFDPNATATDLASDIEVGVAGRSYMMDDGSHMGPKGYNLVSQALILPLIDAVEGGTPFPVRQHICPQQPAVPAVGDVIGNIVAYGAGGTFSVDNSNQQATYTISPSGQITRLTAAPPARDMVRMPVRIAKPGRADKLQRQIWIGERAASGAGSLVEFDGSSVIQMPTARLGGNTNKLTLLFRLQATDQSAIQNVLGGTSQCLVRLLTGGTLDIVWRDASGTTILSQTTTAVFRTTDGPRWVAICLDLTNPAAEVLKVVHWAVPATPTTLTQTTGTIITDTATSYQARLDTPMAFGALSASSGTGATFSKFRIGHFHLWRDYVDFGVLANRQTVCDAAGLPQSAWLASAGGAVAGLTPDSVIRGNATDWRECRSLGNQEWGFSCRRRSDGEYGYLTSVAG